MSVIGERDLLFDYQAICDWRLHRIELMLILCYRALICRGMIGPDYCLYLTTEEYCGLVSSKFVTLYSSMKSIWL
jgi:hypothetical protein